MIKFIDLPFFFTVILSEKLARQFPMCRGNIIPLSPFGARATDNHPCDCYTISDTKYITIPGQQVMK